MPRGRGRNRQSTPDSSVERSHSQKPIQRYHGKLEPFTPNTNLAVRLELLDNFCDWNNVKSLDTKKQVLLNHLSLEAYSILHTNLLPNKPKDKSFQELLKLMKFHFEPPTLKFTRIQNKSSVP